MSVKEIFVQQGGMALLKQYFKGGALFAAVVEFLILGKSRTALEILRLSTQLKIKQTLLKKYKSNIYDFHEEKECNERGIENTRKVWVCWWQGIENAPPIVKKCYLSIKENIKDREIVLITEENYRDYVCFPDFIQTKIDNGIISKTHMSDLLRLELLDQYGGTWIDATVLCTERQLPLYMLDSDLFLFQTLKPGRDGQSLWISSWFITSKRNNKILKLTKNLLYEYWKNNTEMVDYFLIHYFFQLALERYPDEWAKVVPYSNEAPHILLLKLFEKYDENMCRAIFAQTPFHKLSYKFKDEELRKKGTYYDVLIGNNVDKI